MTPITVEAENKALRDALTIISLLDDRANITAALILAKETARAAIAKISARSAAGPATREQGSVSLCECGMPVETRPGIEYSKCFECWWAKDSRNANHKPPREQRAMPEGGWPPRALAYLEGKNWHIKFFLEPGNPYPKFEYLSLAEHQAALQAAVAEARKSALIEAATKWNESDMGIVELIQWLYIEGSVK